MSSSLIRMILNQFRSTTAAFAMGRINGAVGSKRPMESMNIPRMISMIGPGTLSANKSDSVVFGPANATNRAGSAPPITMMTLRRR